MDENLNKLIECGHGFVTASEVANAGIPAMALTRAVRSGDLARVERGVYCTPDTWEDENLLANWRFGRGVLSHETALNLLDLSDDTPERITMTFPRGYNTSQAIASGICAKTVATDLLPLGITSVTTPYGNEVRCYNAERTLCDMLRGTSSPNVQALVPAINAYMRSTKRNIPLLLDTADKLGVRNKIAPYVEVLA